MAETFRDLGLDFPLFEAPVSEASGYLGPETCDTCGAEADHVFDVLDEYVCQACLRARKASITKDTEFGMVRREDAERGRTHGIPGLETDMFPVVPTDDPEWKAAVIPSEDLWELVSTPSYVTWQGDRWLFCCAKPMVYVGPWERRDFERAAPDGDAHGEAERMVGSREAAYWKGAFPDRMSFYVFRCPSCGKRRAHCDID